MDRTFKVTLTEEEEKQFQELCTLYKEYQRHVNGWDAGEHVEPDVLNMWIVMGLAGHMSENYNFLKSVMLEKLKGDAA